MNTKFPFTPAMKMADVIHSNYKLIPIIGRFGIHFGFGNSSVLDVCSKHNINVGFFIEIINSYHNKSYFPTEQLQHFSGELIIDYLTKTHTFYIDSKIPEIGNLIDSLIENVDGNTQNIVLLQEFFNNYKNELVSHFKSEEEEVFPYVGSLERAEKLKEIPGSLLEKAKSDWAKNFERDHGYLEETLFDLKNLIIKFFPTHQKSSRHCQRLLIELFRLEEDLENHAAIEDKVLLPKIESLENKVIQLNDAGKAKSK